MDKAYSLEGRHILVTGASSGIGRAVALRISELGARVTLVARNQERLEQVRSQLKTPGCSYIYDFSDLDGIEAFIKQVVAEQGKFDGMMFCAGDCIRAPLSACKPSIMRKAMQVNFFSFTETLRCVVKNKNCNEGASMIAMTSASSLRGERGLISLSTAKAAMNSAVRCAALELAPKKIRVNAIAAAYIMGSIMIGETVDIFGADQVKENLATLQPLGAGHPEDVADVAAFLLSDASRHMTGTITMVDGGYSA